MKASMGQQLSTKQGIRLSPELRLSLRVLSMNLCELEQYIGEAQAENPALELEPEPDLSAEPASAATMNAENWVETIPEPISLKSHLAWQIETGGFSDFEKVIAARFLDEMDDDGFLRKIETKILVGASLEIQRARKKLMQLNPVGAFSFDLQEALLAQLEDRGYAANSVEGRLIAMASSSKLRHLPKIKSKLRLTDLRMKRALVFIRSLEPIPGRRFRAQGAPIAIIPEVKISVGEKGLQVFSLETSRLKLRLTGGYFATLAHSPDLRSRPYINAKLREAKWLQKAIHQRIKTLHRVASAVAVRQASWFSGKGPLVPLTLREIASDVGLHESTISRVTNGKYIETPKGVFELKYFFSSSVGLGGASSQGSSSRQAKDLIEAAVKKEDKSVPLTDTQLHNLLLKAGVQVARRTVAKYRDQLGIAKSSARRSVIW